MLGGERPFGGTWSVLTEFKQCPAYRVTESKGHDEVREVEEGIEKRYELFGLPSVKTYTVDNAPEMEQLLCDCHQSLQVTKEIVRGAESLRFDEGIGKTIVCVKTHQQIGPVLDTLTDLLQHHKVLGFDMEWDVPKKKGPQARTAIIQLCVKNYCAIFQLLHLKRVPNRLAELLENSEVAKVGLNITEDRNKLLSDWSVLLQNTIELKGLADSKLGYARNRSLASLCELVLGKKLQKPEHIRVSTNWSNKALDREQQEYAAIDAYAGLLVHQRLMETADMLASFNNPQLLEQLGGRDIDKMKVAELKANLEGLMLNKSGQSAELKARLKSAVRFLQGKAAAPADEAPVFDMHIVQQQSQSMRDVADEACVDLHQLIRLNKGRIRKLSRASVLEQGTMLLLPARIMAGDLSVERELSKMDDAFEAQLEAGAFGAEFEPQIAAGAPPQGVQEHITRVKSDIFHLLQRYGRSIPTRHPLRGPFMRCMRDAFFINSGSDYDDVKQHLMRRGMGAADVEQLGRRFFARRVKRFVPKPSELAHRVESVFRVFQGKGTAQHGLLFKGGKDGTEAVHAKVMSIILGGYASDLDGGVYHECSIDQFGLRKYAGNRGSSALEGFHFHLRSCIPGYHTSPRLASAHMQEFVYRWNIRAGIKHLGEVISFAVIHAQH